MKLKKNNNYFISSKYKHKIVDNNKFFLNINRTFEESKIWHLPAYEYCQSFLKNKKQIKIITDYGCGFGLKLNFLKKKNQEKKFIGIDDIKSIKFAKNKFKNILFLRNNLDSREVINLKFKNDLSISIDVIEHMNKPLYLMKKIINNLKIGGYLIISTPERDFCRGTKNIYPGKHHAREWNSKEFSKFLLSFKCFKILDKKILFAYQVSLNKIFISEIKNRIFRRCLKYNQIYLLKKVC